VKALLFLLALGLLIYAAIDCSRTPDNELPSGLPRPVWLVLLLILPILGPVLWLVASRGDSNHTAGGRRPPHKPSARGGAPSRRGPIGPDDDPDFLHGL
jgi:hypothetical protein